MLYDAGWLFKEIKYLINVLNLSICLKLHTNLWNNDCIHKYIKVIYWMFMSVRKDMMMRIAEDNKLYIMDCATQHRLCYTTQAVLHITGCATHHRLRYTPQTVLNITDCATHHRLRYTSHTVLPITDCATYTSSSK